MAKNILVIDDEELIIRSLVKLLERNGYTAMVAKNGQDALAMAEEYVFDLIIADVRMPGINGIQAVKNIYLQKGKNNNKIPTIFITGYADKEIEEEVRTLNPIAYIYKPFDIQQLVSKIKEVLN